MSRVIPEKGYFIFSSLFTICSGVVVTNDCKKIFDVAIALKITILSSSVRLLIFHRKMLQPYKTVFPLSNICCKRSE